MPMAKVSEKGWVVIPKELRKKYGIKPGSQVSFVDLGGTLYLVPIPEDPIEAFRGIWKDDGPSWTEEIVERHRVERAQEEAELAYGTEHDRDNE